MANEEKKIDVDLRWEDVFDDHIFSQLLAIQDEDNPTFVADVIEMYFTQADERLEEMKKMIKQKDTVPFSREAHALKGSAAGIGAKRIVEICQRLQKETPDANLDHAAELAALVERHAEARAVLKKYQNIPV
eukprot:Opistho-2@69264